MATRTFILTVDCTENASSYIDAVAIRQVLLDVGWFGNNKDITEIRVEEGTDDESSQCGQDECMHATH